MICRYCRLANYWFRNDGARFFKHVAKILERSYSALEGSRWIEAPQWQPARKQFRHEKQSDCLLIYLKGIRCVSLFNASIVLLDAGHVHEMGILCRCMDESLEDMMLFIGNLGPDDGPTDKQERVRKEFFQEEFEDPSGSMLSTKKRDRLPRKKVRAAIAALPENPINPHEHAQISETIYDAFSGYVHGAYPHIMELYGGNPPRYHVAGMRDTPRIQEGKRTLIQYAYRCVLGTLYAAKRLGEDGVAQDIFFLREEIEQRYPRFKNDPNVLIRKMKKKDSK